MCYVMINFSIGSRRYAPKHQIKFLTNFLATYGMFIAVEAFEAYFLFRVTAIVKLILAQAAFNSFVWRIALPM